MSSRAAATVARRKRPVAEAAGAGGAAAARTAAERDDGPVCRRAARPPTFAAAAGGGAAAAVAAAADVAAVVRVTRVVRVVVRAADRSTRGDSTRRAQRRLARMVVPRVADDGGTVCDGTASSGCGGSTRAGGAVHRGTRTGWPPVAVVPAGVGSGAWAPLGAGAEVAGTGGWPKPAATGSTTATLTGGKAALGAGNRGNRAVSAPTSIGPVPLRCRKTRWAVVQPCQPTTVAWAPAVAPADRASRATKDGASVRGAATGDV